jgi:hypothetical protein
MKINVMQEIVQLDGAVVKTSNAICPTCQRAVGKSEPLTVRLACGKALVYRDPQSNMEFKEQMERGELATRFYQNDEVELTTLEAGKIQGLVAEIYGPLVTYQVGMILEGASEVAASPTEREAPSSEPETSTP